ncbi:Collagen binding domain protein [compost metagenome]
MKEITWTLGVNYTGKEVTAPIVSDVLTAGQSLVPGSLQVYKMNLDAKGDYTQGAEVSSSAYSYTVGSGNQLKIVFADSIAEPYYVVFKTSLAGQLIDSTVTNTAKLLDGTVPVSKDWTASVKIPHGGEYIYKSGLQNGDKVDWSLAVNWTQSHVKDAKITDIPSTNQILLPDSFHLYAGTVAADGEVTKSGTELVKGVDYTIEFIADASGQQSFELSFTKDIDTAYILEYQSLIAAGTGDKLANTAKFSGNNVVLVEKQTSTEVIVGVSSGSGTGSGTKGTLTVKKLDAANDERVLAGATFELYRLNGSDRVLINTRTTDSAGLAVFNNIWLGSYIVIETAAPDGYVLDTSEYPVTIGSAASVNLTVYNTAVQPTETPGVPVTPTPSESPSPTVSPSPSPAVTPAPTSNNGNSGGSSGGTPTASQIPGVIIDDDAIPGGPAITPQASAGPSASPASPTADPGETTIDEEIPLGGIDVEDDDVPKGTVSEATGGKLPQTGESSPLPIYLGGLALIAAGFVLNRVFRRNRDQ